METKLIQITKGQYVLVDEDDFDELNSHKWFSCSGYAMRKIPGGKGKVFLMHRIINRTPEGVWTDHINGNGLDNRKSNLRNCTREQNYHNVKLSTKNSSGYKGVNWAKTNKRWEARIHVNGKHIRLGYFKTPEEAGAAYVQAQREMHGEFARIL